MNTSGARFVPRAALTHDDVDTNSDMSDISLHFPASANVSSKISALVTFSQAGGDPVQNVCSLHPKPNQTGVHPWQRQYPVTYPQSVFAVLGRKTIGSNDYTTSTRSSISAKRLVVLCFIHKEKFLLPLISMKWLRSKTLSILWRGIAKHTITTCRCKLGTSNMKQTRGFLPKTNEIVIAFSQKANQALESQRFFW